MLLEVSDEKWTLDDDGAGSWKVQEEVVAVDPETGEGEAVVNTLDRRLSHTCPSQMTYATKHTSSMTTSSVLHASSRLCSRRTSPESALSSTLSLTSYTQGSLGAQPVQHQG